MAQQAIVDERVVNSTTISSGKGPLTDAWDPVVPTLGDEEDEYDYKGALLFVVGLLSVYGVAILLLIVSLIRKSRSALEVKDHQRDFEAMRRASQKRSLRMSRENSEKAASSVSSCGRLSLASRGKAYLDNFPLERMSLCKTVNEDNGSDSDGSARETNRPSFSTLRRPPLVSPIISALRATEDPKVVAL